MDARDVMAALEAAGKPATAAIYRKHGVRDPALGVPYADIDKLARRIKVDHALALALWDTGVHEARVLATRVADPDALSREAITAWLEPACDHPTNDAVSALAARRRDAAEVAQAWMARPDEWGRAAGWNVVAALVLAGQIPAARAKALVKRIRDEIGSAPNRARHTMNGALIAIGGAVDAARDVALAAAAAIGKVEVDHGETGCKTPDADPYIRKMAQRAAARSGAGGGAGKGARAKRHA